METNITVRIIQNKPNQETVKLCMLCMHGAGRFRIEGYMTNVKDILQIDYALFGNVPETDRKFCGECKKLMTQFTAFKSRAQWMFNQICSIYHTRRQLLEALGQRDVTAEVSVCKQTSAALTGSGHQKKKGDSAHSPVKPDTAVNHNAVTLDVHLTGESSSRIPDTEQAILSCLGIRNLATAKSSVPENQSDTSITRSATDITSVNTVASDRGDWTDKSTSLVKNKSAENELTRSQNQGSTSATDQSNNDKNKVKEETCLDHVTEGNSSEVRVQNVEGHGVSGHEVRGEEVKSDESQHINSFLGAPGGQMIPLTPTQVLSILPTARASGFKAILPKPPAGSSVTLQIPCAVLQKDSHITDHGSSKPVAATTSDGRKAVTEVKHTGSKPVTEGKRDDSEPVTEATCDDAHHAHKPVVMVTDSTPDLDKVTQSSEVKTDKVAVQSDSKKDESEKVAEQKAEDLHVTPRMRTRGIKLDVLHHFNKRPPKREENDSDSPRVKRGRGRPPKSLEIVQTSPKAQPKTESSKRLKMPAPKKPESQTKQGSVVSKESPKSMAASPPKRGRGRPPKYVVPHRDQPVIVQATESAFRERLSESTIPLTDQPVIRERTKTGQPGIEEATTKDKSVTVEARIKDKPGIVEATTKDKPGIVDATTKDKPGIVEATTKDKPGIGEATTKDKRDSVEATTRKSVNNKQSDKIEEEMADNRVDGPDAQPVQKTQRTDSVKTADTSTAAKSASSLSQSDDSRSTLTCTDKAQSSKYVHTSTPADKPQNYDDRKKTIDNMQNCNVSKIPEDRGGTSEQILIAGNLPGGDKTVVSNYTLPPPSIPVMGNNASKVPMATVTVTMTNSKNPVKELENLNQETPDSKHVLHVAQDVRKHENHHQRVARVTAKYGQLYHAQSVMYECQVCSDRTTRMIDLEYHIFRMHSDKIRQNKTEETRTPLIKCVGCDLTFYSITELKVHRKEVHGTKTRNKKSSTADDDTKKTRHVCDICGKILGTKLRDLRKHILNVHEVCNDYECSTCGKKFGSNWYLQEHMLMHSNTYSFICEYCGKGFKREYDYKMHILIHTGKGFLCNICGMMCKSRDNLKRHKYLTHKTFKTFKCSMCLKTLKENMIILNHGCFRSRKKDAFNEKMDDSGRPIYTCRTCGASFDKKCNTVIHVLKEGHIPDVPADMLPNMARAFSGREKAKKNYTCPTCNMNFLTTKDCTEHIDSAICTSQSRHVSEDELKMLLQNEEVSLLRDVTLIRSDEPVMGQTVFCMCPRCDCLTSNVTVLQDHMAVCDVSRDKNSLRFDQKEQLQIITVGETEDFNTQEAVSVLSDIGDNVAVAPSKFVPVSLGPNAQKFVKKQLKKVKQPANKKKRKKRSPEREGISAVEQNLSADIQDHISDFKEDKAVSEINDVMPVTTYLCAVCNHMFMSMLDIQSHMRDEHGAMAVTETESEVVPDLVSEVIPEMVVSHQSELLPSVVTSRPEAGVVSQVCDATALGIISMESEPVSVVVPQDSGSVCHMTSADTVQHLQESEVSSHATSH